jgi:hypothetical protein
VILAIWLLGACALGALIVTGAVRALADWPEQWTRHEHCRTCRMRAQLGRSQVSNRQIEKAA